MEAAEKVFEALEQYRNELRTQIKASESRLKELASAIPLAEQRTKSELDKLQIAFGKEKVALEEAIAPLREQKRVLEKQVNEARAEFELFLSQKGNAIENQIGAKNLELNGITKRVEEAGKRLALITDEIFKVKESVTRL